MNIAMLLQMAADACPDRKALTSGHLHFTYKEVLEAAAKAAVLIRNSGCRYVALLDVSSPAAPVALMGAAMAGVPYVPLNYRLTHEQLDGLLSRIEPALIITDPVLPTLEVSGGSIVKRRPDFLQEVEQVTAADVSWPEDPGLVAVQLFTSGTTGTPKAAILRHEHITSYILGSVEFMSAAEGDSALVTVPPYHIAGISAVLSGIYSCRRIVQLPDFGAAIWLNLCKRENVTNAFVVPTMLSRIVDHIGSIDGKPELPSLRAIAYGGGRMPVPVIERALEIFEGVDFTNAYGLTETSSTIALLGPEDHRAAFASHDPLVRERLGSVGRPLPSVELEIRNEAGKVLGPGQSGEIYVRGPQVSGEYLERNACGADGWFPTRDAGYLDDDGYLFLSGRADDVIVRGGENISPAEIEDVLREHPAVADVAALGIPSDEWGETVGTVVVLRPGEEEQPAELRHFVKARLRSSREPESIVFIPELPYNEMGKLLRRELRALFA
ncbi:class I adenylate-forming enzyme family protein [Pseudohaliea sp.]|uniref:class I adenylate-forming enzyme family protein n=1 Tax=Pseudohaliea sp. TaxID=2740289 RepID=UPI0032ECA5E1